MQVPCEIETIITRPPAPVTGLKPGKNAPGCGRKPLPRARFGLQIWPMGIRPHPVGSAEDGT